MALAPNAMESGTVLDFAGTFEEAVEGGEIPSPPLMSWNDFQRWRSTDGRRPSRTVRSHRQEAALWRAAMERYHGATWRERLEEQELAVELPDAPAGPGAPDPAMLALPAPAPVPAAGAGVGVMEHPQEVVRGGAAVSTALTPRAAADAAREAAAREPASPGGGGSTGESEASRPMTPGGLSEALRSDYDPAMESVDDYRNRMRRMVAICALRGIPVNQEEISEQAVQADVMAAIYGLEEPQAVHYLKESAGNLLTEPGLDPEGRMTLKILLNQLQRYGVTLIASQDKLFSGHTTNSSPEKRPGDPARNAAPEEGG